MYGWGREMERQAEHWYKLYQDLKEVVRVEQDLWAYEVMELEEDMVDMKEDCEAEVEEMEGALEEEESRCYWQTEVMAVELEAVEGELEGLWYDQRVRRWEEEQEGACIKKQGKKKEKK